MAAAAVVAVVAALTGAGCGATRPAREPTAPGPAPRRLASNIVRGDYAGSARCQPCHREIHAAWERSPMHRMTRVPETTEVRAPFNGRVFRFKDDTARVTQAEGARFVQLSSSTFGDHAYRVTRVIGGRYREDFAGIEVAAPVPTAPVIESHLAGHAAGAELLLPLSYVFETGSFRLKGYSVMVGERPGLRAGGVWNQTCVFCHNTTPYFDDTWGELHGPGAPAYQGEVVDRLLPPERRWTFELTDPPAFARALDEEARVVDAGARIDVAAAGGASEPARREALARGMTALRTHLRPEHFVELGVGCESCHGGSRAHVDDARVLPDFAPRSAFLRATPPAGWGEVTRAEWINRACARCHQVLFSRYPFTWEGKGRRVGEAGGSSITSGEARDFLLGGCARQMSCVTCHDPHGEDRREALARLATPAGNSTCTRCHGAYAAPEALRAHAHHDPAGAGGSCVACHMPRKNMGLGYALTRYHRIGAPTETARVEGDRPLECALCHADRSVATLVGEMERFWGKHYDRAKLAALYGDLDALPLEATLARGKPHEQATALGVLGEARAAAALPAAAGQLTNPVPLVRYYARRAVEQIRGAACDVDLDRATAEIELAARRCVSNAAFATPLRAAAGPTPGPPGAPARGRRADAFDED
ncbi:MAG TPA: cytochrome c3 family protein [Polyangia bacterium]|nr:cytochrome c3 family protein [Polyangia bacterium]